VAATVWSPARMWIPQRLAQVNAGVVERYSTSTAALIWGSVLGTGVLTLVVTPALYGLIAVAVTQDSATASAIVGVVYGAARGGSIAVAAVSEGRSDAHQAERLEQHLRIPLAIATILALVSTWL
jgi:hypothetical protein